MPIRELLSPAQRRPFLTFPELAPRELARYYTLSPDDLAVIHQRRGAANKLGFAVQLALARFPGWALQPEQAIPPAIVATLAEQLGLDPASFAAYARTRDTTRREHLAEIQRVFGFRPFTARVYRELAAWLLPTALATDDGIALVRALIDELRPRMIIAPAFSTIERLAWETRRRARRQV